MGKMKKKKRKEKKKEKKRQKKTGSTHLWQFAEYIIFACYSFLLGVRFFKPQGYTAV